MIPSKKKSNITISKKGIITPVDILSIVMSGLVIIGFIALIMINDYVQNPTEINNAGNILYSQSLQQYGQDISFSQKFIEETQTICNGLIANTIEESVFLMQECENAEQFSELLEKDVTIQLNLQFLDDRSFEKQREFLISEKDMSCIGRFSALSKESDYKGFLDSFFLPREVMKEGNSIFILPNNRNGATYLGACTQLAFGDS